MALPETQTSVKYTPPTPPGPRMMRAELLFVWSYLWAAGHSGIHSSGLSDCLRNKFEKGLNNKYCCRQTEKLHDCTKCIAHACIPGVLTLVGPVSFPNFRFESVMWSKIVAVKLHVQSPGPRCVVVEVSGVVCVILLKGPNFRSFPLNCAWFVFFYSITGR